MLIYAIDPGASMCGHVIFDGEKVHGSFELNPAEMLYKIRSDVEELAYKQNGYERPCLAIEMIEARGMSVGQETFDTAMWVGRYVEAWDSCCFDSILVYRREVKLHLCGSSRAGDPNIRRALIDRFGGNKVAIGKKRSPGPLYGVYGHAWAALAVAALCFDHLEGRVDTIRSKT